MPIRCNLSTLMGKHRYNIQTVNDKTGLARSTIANMYHDKMERFDRDTLDKLCKLFNCTVGDIIEYYRDEG